MAPGTLASFGRSRAMMRSAEIFRSSSGFSEMNRRAVLYVLPPVNPFTVSTAGSAATILIIGSMILSMA